MKAKCNICILECNLNENDLGICNKFFARGNGLEFVSSDYLWFSRGIPIEAFGMYHFYPGSYFDFWFIGNTPKYRYPLVNTLTRIQLSNLPDLYNNEKIVNIHKRLFIGGIEPLIDVDNNPLFKKILRNYELVALETQGLLNYEIMNLGKISALLIDLVLIHNSYITMLLRKNELIEKINYLLNLKKHLEIALIIPKKAMSTDIFNKYHNLFKKILDMAGPNIPIHLVRYRFSHNDSGIPNLFLRKLWKKMKHMGFNFIYVDWLYSSSMNYTYCPENEKVIFEHHGPWLRIRFPNLTKDCLKNFNFRGKARETFPKL